MIHFFDIKIFFTIPEKGWVTPEPEERVAFQVPAEARGLCDYGLVLARVVVPDISAVCEDNYGCKVLNCSDSPYLFSDHKPLGQTGTSLS